MPLPDEAEALLPASVRVHEDIDAHDILTYAEQVLSPPQLAALRRHLLGDSDEVIQRRRAAEDGLKPRSSRSAR